MHSAVYGRSLAFGFWQEAELVEARLERSQAQAKAQRAQQRLDDFLAEQPDAQVLNLHLHCHQICFVIPTQASSSHQVLLSLFKHVVRFFLCTSLSQSLS